MRRKKVEEDEVIEANVLPVMNIMFLMIPALLLAMEIAKMAAVAVSPPKFAAAPSDQKEPEKPEEKPLKFKVFILSDGFRVSTAEQQEGAEAGKSQDSSGGPSIPLAKPGAPMDDYERYDYVALEAKAKELKTKAKHETIVTLSAENDIPMQVLIYTMDAVRGSECKLLTLKEDEPMPEECLFFQPIVEAGAG
jgi:biopolymer transport protein ExbD